MKNNVLHTKEVTIGYTKGTKKNIVQEDITLSIDEGKLIALIGKNGIGKSTFLKTITGIIPCISGEILLKDKNINTYQPTDLAQELSLVLTESLPPSNLNVYEIVALGRQPYTNWLGTLTDEDEAKINDAIALTEISNYIHKKHYEISDGQLQKVMIARALAQDTSLIILDEPTTHLDLVHKVSLLKLLQKLAHETNKTILYSTHDLDLAIQLADEMIVFTEDTIFKDQPCNLISNGIFEQLFSNENIQFDAILGKFKIK